jgi:hypothetical protein
MIAHGIDLDSAAIRDFCHRREIRRLFVFGSILREDFGPESDVDFLFELEPTAKLTMDSWIAMEDELTGIVGRRVDLVPRKDVEASANYIRRKHILTTAEPVYGS